LMRLTLSAPPTSSLEFDIEGTRPIPTRSFPPSTNSILALPSDSTRKSRSAPGELNIVSVELKSNRLTFAPAKTV
jgi:hypothetical protein